MHFYRFSFDVIRYGEKQSVYRMGICFNWVNISAYILSHAHKDEKSEKVKSVKRLFQ